ncbi:MAG: enoyl-CoA hydratase/isomerase family protein [Deltaproteobacteria bacterium]|nr:enoyl-CoA hydratase/isomerase family protein [Deltaproteobacteria bacterium]
MSEERILVSVDETIATIVMNRPEMMNALDLDMIDDFQKALDALAPNEEVHVVVIEGAGGNFCTGASMARFTEGLSAPFWQMAMKKLHRVILTMREIPQPVITKVRGMAVGGGINIALAGDFVLAGESARFREVFVNHGLVLDSGGTYFLPRLVGMVKARELALLGEMLDGRTAAECGLIYRACPDNELDEAVHALARRLAKKPPGAVALIKSSLEKSFDMTLPEVLEWEAAQQAIMVQTDAVKEAGERFFKSKMKS